MWSRSLAFQIGETRYATLNDCDTLLTAAVGLASDLQRSHHNIRKIWDICQMLRQLDGCTDWDLFLAECAADNSLKVVLNIFSFCLHLTGMAEDCTELARAMSGHEGLILIGDQSRAETVFARGRGHLANRLLYSRMLPVSPGAYWLHRSATLPMRIWHYRRTGPRAAKGR